MRNVAIALTRLLCMGHGLRLQGQLAESGQMADASSAKATLKVTQVKALAKLLQAYNSTSAFAPGWAVGFKGATHLGPGLGSVGPKALPDRTAGAGTARGPRAAASMAAAPALGMVNQVGAAAGWMSALRSPAALVAGASLSAAYSLDKDLQPRKGDERWVSVLKKAGKLLYLSAFALEIACVFSATVTGTMLLGKGVPNPLAVSPLDMLHREAEFEYLLCRVAFFQGLLNWLSAVALHQALPKKGITKAAQRLHFSTAASISTIVTLMVAFYNKHISYYANYGAMITRLFTLLATRFYGSGFRLLPILAIVPAYIAVKEAVLSVRDVDNKEAYLEDEDGEAEET